jgi:hypothetical protein
MVLLQKPGFNGGRKMGIYLPCKYLAYLKHLCFRIRKRIIQMLEGLRAHLESLGRGLHEEAKFKSALTQLLREFRKIFDDSSPLAKSIDSNGPSREVAIFRGAQ